MSRLLQILLFFPSITFSLVSAEIFPWALIYSFKLNPIINYRILLFIGALFLSSIFSFFYGYYYNLETDIIRSFLAYLNPVLIFYCIILISEDKFELLKKVFFGVFIFLIVLGLFQFFGLIKPLDPFFRFLLVRGASDKLEGARGVNLLATEPSRAAIEFLFFGMCYLYFKNFNIKKNFLFDFFLIVYLLFIIRSALGLFLLMMYFLFKYKLKFMLSLLIIGLFMIPFISGDIRALNIVLQIVSTSSIEELYKLLLNASGFRLLSLISGYSYGFLFPFGGGVGLWQNSIIESFYILKFDPQEITYFIFNHDGRFAPIRPTSYVASLMLDVGIIGFVCFFIFIYPFLKIGLTNKRSFVFTAVFGFYLFFFGAVGNPVPWVCFALIIRDLNTSNLG